MSIFVSENNLTNICNEIKEAHKNKVEASPRQRFRLNAAMEEYIRDKGYEDVDKIKSIVIDVMRYAEVVPYENVVSCVDKTCSVLDDMMSGELPMLSTPASRVVKDDKHACEPCEDKHACEPCEDENWIDRNRLGIIATAVARVKCMR